MLTVEALEAALPLTALLDQSGAVVNPVPNTPLALLVQETRSSEQCAAVDAQGVVSLATQDIAYLANSRDEHTGVSPHDTTLDHLVSVGVKAVQTHLQIVRGRVVPAVTELYKAVRQHMEDVTASELLGMEVKICDLPGPMKNGAIESLISKYENTPLASPALKMKCPDLTAQEIQTLMHTGASGFDADIDKWLAIKGETWLLTLWQNMFTQKSDAYRVFRDCVEHREDGMDHALAVFLISRKLAEEAIEGVEMSLPAFTTLACEFRNQAAAKISRVMEDWAKLKKQGILVKWQGGKTVIVNECVYRPWIEAGGENEVLFGGLLENEGFVTVARLDAEAARLKAAWNRHVGITGVIERASRFNAMKRFLATEFRRQIEALEEDTGGPDINAANRAQVMRLFNAELAKIKPTESDDLYSICLKLVCRSRFHQTDAETFLLNFERIKQSNPSMELREVGTLATIEYVADWVACQFTVSKATA